MAQNIDVETRERFQYWRTRTFYSIFIGYIFYYFTRKSFTFAMPALMSDLAYTKSDVGLLLTIFSVTYGVSKFVSGILGDKSNPRYFMGAGLIITGIFNLCFGMSSHMWLFILFWGLNGWFQGFGWPPCARLLAYWYSDRSRGTWWAIWSTSHNIGGALIPIIAALCLQWADWRYALYVPGVMCIVMGFWVMERLRDTPCSIGLPSADAIDGVHEQSREKSVSHLSVKEILFKYVIFNKYIWFLSMANFFVYVIRTGINDWTMLYLSEERGFSMIEAGMTMPWFEAGGILGMLSAGWCSDKIFNGNRGVISFLYMMMMVMPLTVFWMEPSHNYVFNASLMFFSGLFIFGPQMLVGCAAAEKSHKDAAATASGFAGTFGYLGAACAGYPFGLLLEGYGWNGFFVAMLFSSVLGALCFLPFFSNDFGLARLMAQAKLFSR